MIVHAIGLMSGSSLDGLDIFFVRLTEVNGNWQYQGLASSCIPYPKEWEVKLRQAKSLSVPEFLNLHTAYGHFTGKLVHEFIRSSCSGLPVDLVVSHGHTIFHDPANGTSFQLGDGAAIAAETGIPVVSDLRNLDIANGGQGAPLVPLGEQLLFPEFDFWLNLGGICNISFRENTEWVAFDVVACNQLLNALAATQGKAFDANGALAAAGQVDVGLLNQLDAVTYFQLKAPKSLDNSFSTDVCWPLIESAKLSVADKLRTVVEHIAGQIAACIPPSAIETSMLVTGGGAFNSFLVARIQDRVAGKILKLKVPDGRTVQYKEALIMALLGTLRWLGRPTIIPSVTGARKASIGGALWIGS